MTQFAQLPFSPIVCGHDCYRGGHRIERPNGTNDWLVAYTVSGSAFFRGERSEFDSQAGDAVLIRPDTPHCYGQSANTEIWEVLWAHFCPPTDWLGCMNWPEMFLGTMTVSVDGEAKVKTERLMLEMCGFNTSALAQKVQFAMNALESALLWINTQNPESPEYKVDRRVQSCMEYICANYVSPLSTSDLVRVSGLSASRILHLFSDQIGKTPVQYLEMQRIEQARQQLIATQRSVGEIASAVGYESAFYFTLRFKKMMGVPPTVYRQQYVKDAIKKQTP